MLYFASAVVCELTYNVQRRGVLQVRGRLQPRDLHAERRQSVLGGQRLPGGPGSLSGRYCGGTGVPWEGRQEGRQQIQAAEQSRSQEEEQEEGGEQEAGHRGEQRPAFKTRAVMEQNTFRDFMNM